MAIFHVLWFLREPVVFVSFIRAANNPYSTVGIDVAQALYIKTLH